MIIKFALIIPLLLPPPLKATPNISVSPEAQTRLKACPSIFYTVENSPEVAKQAVITMFDSMMTGLKSSGLTNAEAEQVLNGIKVTMEIAGEQNDPLLIPVVKFMNRFGGRPSAANENLMICVVSAGCQLNAKTFGPSSSYSAYIFGRRSNAPPKLDIDTNSGISLSREELIVISPYRIQPTSPSESYIEGVVRIANWYGQFFRDVTQSSSLDLLDRWVQANERLIANGQSSDSFYNQFKSSETDRKQLYYVLNFVTSHAAGFAARRNYIAEVITSGAENIIAKAEKDARQSAIRDINRLAGSDAVTKYGLNEQNVFEMGVSLQEMMEVTILSAQ